MTAMSVLRASNAANPFPDLPAIRGPDASSQVGRASGPIVRRFPGPRFGDYSRTRFESRVAFGGPEEDAEEVVTPARQFTLLEITSGLPDDSREADERDTERRLRDLRGRVKAARAAISATPGAAEVLQRDWMRAARFYAGFGLTEALFREGARDGSGDGADNPLDQSRSGGTEPSHSEE